MEDLDIRYPLAKASRVLVSGHLCQGFALVLIMMSDPDLTPKIQKRLNYSYARILMTNLEVDLSLNGWESRNPGRDSYAASPHALLRAPENMLGHIGLLIPRACGHQKAADQILPDKDCNIVY